MHLLSEALPPGQINLGFQPDKDFKLIDKRINEK